MKAGREKHIGNRGMILNWLTERGLSIRQAREFVKAGLDRWDLAEAISRRFAQGR